MSILLEQKINELREIIQKSFSDRTTSVTIVIKDRDYKISSTVLNQNRVINTRNIKGEIIK